MGKNTGKTFLCEEVHDICEKCGYNIKRKSRSDVDKIMKIHYRLKHPNVPCVLDKPIYDKTRHEYLYHTPINKITFY